MTIQRRPPRRTASSLPPALPLLVGLLCLQACRRDTPPPAATAPPPAAPSSPAAPPAAIPAPPAAAVPWTPERVRELVLGVHLSIEKVVDDLTRKRDRAKILGECYGGESAGALAKTADVLPLLEQQITGPALPCYLASYFGCTIGEWIGRAGIAKVGPGFVPFTRSRVTIVEQTPERVVADVIEADINAVIDGEINRAEISEKIEATLKEKSRYTLTRDPGGTWRISDRQPSFNDWECRPR
jgi:hypothetical protein